MPGALSAGECRQWIDRFEAAGYASMARHYPPGYRNNHRAILDAPALAATLRDRFDGLFPPIWPDRDGRRWTFDGLNPRFRACRYQPGESFQIHRDGAQANDGRRTFLTLMLYLNDASEFVGGTTHFYASKAAAHRLHTVRPQAGLAVVFPHDAWHEGAVVDRGVKYVLRSDLVYRRDDERERATGHRGYVWDAAALPNGGAVTVGRDGRVVRWDGGSTPARPRAQTLPGAGPTAVTVTATGRVVVGNRLGQIVDVAEPSRHLADMGAAVLALRAWADGVLVADAAGRLTALDGHGQTTARWTAGFGHGGRRPWLWAITTKGAAVWVGHGAAVTELRGARLQPIDTQPTPATVRALAARADGRLALGLHDGRVLRRTASGLHLVGRHGGAVRSVAWLDEHRIVSGGEDDHVRVWDRDGEDRSMRHEDFVTRVLVLPDGAILSTSYDETVRRWPAAAAGVDRVA